jgi:uncharacterized membrane protein
MKVRTLVMLIALVAFAAFVALNWSVFIVQTSLSVGFANVQAPLGLVMLGLLAFLAALFLVFVIYLQTSFLLEARRNAKELQASRELAQQAETSRFIELREFLETELGRQVELDAESRSAVLARLDQLAGDLRSTIEQTGNTLSAYIDELEDRLERAGLSPRE